MESTAIVGGTQSVRGGAPMKTNAAEQSRPRGSPLRTSRSRNPVIERPPSTASTATWWRTSMFYGTGGCSEASTTVARPHRAADDPGFLMLARALKPRPGTGVAAPIAGTIPASADGRAAEVTPFVGNPPLRREPGPWSGLGGGSARGAGVFAAPAAAPSEVASLGSCCRRRAQANFARPPDVPRAALRRFTPRRRASCSLVPKRFLSSSSMKSDQSIGWPSFNAKSRTSQGVQT